MNWGSLLAIYFVAWWIILFAVLPFGVHTQQDEGDVVLGSAASAPVRPRLLRTAIATSIVSAILVGAFWVAVEYYGFSLAMIAGWFSWQR